MVTVLVSSLLKEFTLILHHWSWVSIYFLPDFWLILPDYIGIQSQVMYNHIIK